MDATRFVVLVRDLDGEFRPLFGPYLTRRSAELVAKNVTDEWYKQTRILEEYWEEESCSPFASATRATGS